MKQFFKMMFASVLGVLVAFAVIVIVSVFLVFGIVSTIGPSSSYSPDSNSVLKIALSGSLSENGQSNPFGSLFSDTEEQLSLRDIQAAIKAAKTNHDIKGIYLEAGSFSVGAASALELRRALIDFKSSGKFIVAYGDQYSQANYYICSVADKVFLNPQGALELVGMASQTVFYKGLMDKIGVQEQIFKVGTYKGAVEPFMLDHLSNANREQIESYLNGIWGNITKGIAESRKISVDEVNDFANKGVSFSDPKEAVSCGLIDELKYRSDAEEYVKKKAGQKGDDDLKYGDVTEVSSLLKEKHSSNKIAVLYAEGEITADEGSSSYSMDNTINSDLVKQLIKLRKDKDVKAVVMRVNSPGGSAFVSDQIWKQIVELKKVKPVVVSMSNYAASGGYYISCAANKIVAEPTTITGSIGIFGMFPNASGLFGKLALTSDVVKTNDFSDLGDITRPMRDDEKALIQGTIERGYRTFISRCAEGRKKSVAEIDSIGQGRVWTGEQALQRGLVDQLGGLDTAVKEAAKLAKVNDYAVSNVSGSSDFFDQIMKKTIGDIRLKWIRSTLGVDYDFFHALDVARHNQGIQARLPYDMKVF